MKISAQGPGTPPGSSADRRLPREASAGGVDWPAEIITCPRTVTTGGLRPTLPGRQVLLLSHGRWDHHHVLPRTFGGEC